MTAAELENMNNNVEDLVASAASQVGNMNQEDWMIGLGDVVRQTDIMEEEPLLEEDDEDFLDLQTNVNVDWSSDRIKLGLTDIQIDEAKEWIDRMKLSADINVDCTTAEVIQPSALNTDQKSIFDVIMKSLSQDQPQKLIDVSGPAGSGKSFLIKAILQHAQKISGHRNLVKIVAPTGSAGSQFPDGQTIHSLLKIPVQKGCGDLVQLEGKPLRDLQESFKDTRAVIIDEKGMVGLGRLSQINQRLRQAKPQASDLSFGGLTVMLAGDLRQLQEPYSKNLFQPFCNASVLSGRSKKSGTLKIHICSFWIYPMIH